MGKREQRLHLEALRRGLLFLQEEPGFRLEEKTEALLFSFLASTDSTFAAALSPRDVQLIGRNIEAGRPPLEGTERDARLQECYTHADSLRQRIVELEKSHGAAGLEMAEAIGAADRVRRELKAERSLTDGILSSLLEDDPESPLVYEAVPIERIVRVKLFSEGLALVGEDSQYLKSMVEALDENADMRATIETRILERMPKPEEPTKK